MIKIAPSILSADFTRLGEEIKKVEQAGADLIHADVMDGHFVPNITIGGLVVKAAKRATALPLDVHLMIENPDRYIPDFAKAGADILSIHVEASRNLSEDLELIRRAGCRPAIAVNPATPIEPYLPVLTRVEMVLLMTVNPGFEKQAFMPEVLPKIKLLRKKIEEAGLKIDIEVDGGINPQTAKEVIKAGANVLVAGSAVFYSKDYKDTICLLKKT
ncbi:MAG TPA: ribulose-phosphate 3-epimerase [Candidatus Omnitrophota bacterium]|nr:ribulose-phosphate 3-epimerase [Candidatus Omnitrophota bacterium]